MTGENDLQLVACRRKHYCEVIGCVVRLADKDICCIDHPGEPQEELCLSIRDGWIRRQQRHQVVYNAGTANAEAAEWPFPDVIEAVKRKESTQAVCRDVVGRDIGGTETPQDGCQVRSQWGDLDRHHPRVIKDVSDCEVFGAFQIRKSAAKAASVP